MSAATLAITGLAIALMLVRPRDWPEVVWVAPAAALLVVLGLEPAGAAAHAIAAGADVYLFLIGMMLLAELARRHGVFDWLAATAVRHARGSCARLFTWIFAVGVAVTVLMSNDATAVVLTPAIAVAVRKAKVAPLPYLFACAMVANAASFALPISNPANLVVFHGAALPALGAWIARFALPCLAATVVTYVVLRHVFRRELAAKIDPDAAADEPEPLRAEGKWVLAGVGLVVAAMLAASACDVDLGAPACAAAIAVAIPLSIRARTRPRELAAAVSWTTLALVAALFVLVDAVERTGGLGVTSAWLAHAQTWSEPASSFAIAGVVGVANNVVNNLPLGLVAGATVQATHATGAPVTAVLIGVDLGPNLAVTGSLATILWLIALRREGQRVGFWAFLRVGALAMPTALAAAVAVALLASKS